jgi:uncharacterized membrane protein YsdA (DUF1294 family)
VKQKNQMPGFNILTFAQFYFLVVCAMSILSIFMYADDKQRAQLGEWRIRERTLLLVAFFGGWPGAIYAQRRFRHKTKKFPFQVNFWGIVATHLAIVGFATYSIIAWPLPPAAMKMEAWTLPAAAAEKEAWTPQINSIQQQQRKEQELKELGGDTPN